MNVKVSERGAGLDVAEDSARVVQKLGKERSLVNCLDGLEQCFVEVPELGVLLE